MRQKKYFYFVCPLKIVFEPLKFLRYSSFFYSLLYLFRWHQFSSKKPLQYITHYTFHITIKSKSNTPYKLFPYKRILAYDKNHSCVNFNFLLIHNSNIFVLIFFLNYSSHEKCWKSKWVQFQEKCCVGITTELISLLFMISFFHRIFKFFVRNCMINMLLTITTFPNNPFKFFRYFSHWDKRIQKRKIYLSCSSQQISII